MRNLFTFYSLGYTSRLCITSTLLLLLSIMPLFTFITAHLFLPRAAINAVAPLIPSSCTSSVPHPLDRGCRSATYLSQGGPSNSTDSRRPRYPSIPAAHTYPTELAMERRLSAGKGMTLLRSGEKKGFSPIERESFFLPARLSSHGACTGMGETINQSHVLGTISRSMPRGSPPSKSGSLSRSVAFFDSGVAASTSVDAYLSTYLPIYLGRCTVSAYSPPSLHCVTQNRRRRFTTRTRLGSDDASRRGCEHLFEFSQILRSSARLSRCKSGRMKEDRAPPVLVVDEILLFFPFFYLK